MKLRLDDLLVERGLAADRHEAVALAMRGLVRIDGQLRTKAGTQVDRSCRAEVLEIPRRYVSRGGLKLEAALAFFGVDPSGLVCVDLGSSTGGFTDCLLQKGASRVHAFDVGQGQLDWRLRQDERVEVREGENVRHLGRDDVPREADLVVADLSFISLKLVFPVLRHFERARFVLLVKPQFEARKEEVGEGGLIREPVLREEIVARIREAAEIGGLRLLGEMESPVVGRKGNVETFLYAGW